MKTANLQQHDCSTKDENIRIREVQAIENLGLRNALGLSEAGITMMDNQITIGEYLAASSQLTARLLVLI